MLYDGNDTIYHLSNGTAAMGADDAAGEDVWNLLEGGGIITNGREYSISC